jgi:lipopolysaccharide assembly outer membrane protein LptD (OstA)
LPLFHRTARLWRLVRDERVYAQADTVTYASDDLIIFQGGVELYCGLFILTANELVYDARGQTLVASGLVVMKNPDGSRTEVERFVLPAEIRDAFARSLGTTYGAK